MIIVMRCRNAITLPPNITLSRREFHIFSASTEKYIVCTIILLKSICLSVDVSKLQVAIRARSSWEMSETVRID